MAAGDHADGTGCGIPYSADPDTIAEASSYELASGLLHNQAMGLLAPADQDKLRESFSEMTAPVRLLFFTQTLDCETCLHTRQILDELPLLSDRVSIEEVNFILEKDRAAQYGIDRVPAMCRSPRRGRARPPIRGSGFSGPRPATSSSRWCRRCCWSAAPGRASPRTTAHAWRRSTSRSRCRCSPHPHDHIVRGRSASRMKWPSPTRTSPRRGRSDGISRPRAAGTRQRRAQDGDQRRRRDSRRTAAGSIRRAGAVRARAARLIPTAQRRLLSAPATDAATGLLRGRSSQNARPIPLHAANAVHSAAVKLPGTIGTAFIRMIVALTAMPV